MIARRLRRLRGLEARTQWGGETVALAAVKRLQRRRSWAAGAKRRPSKQLGDVAEWLKAAVC